MQFEGSAEGIVAPGTQQVDTGQAARLLVSRQPGSELDRLVTVQDVMDAWCTRLRDPAVARETLQAQPELAPLVAAAKIADRRTDTLPVESITTAGAEGFRPRGADVVDYVVAAFPDALLAPKGDRPRVEVLNGTGAVGLAQTIASQIVPAGAQVTLAGNVPRFGLEGDAGRLLPGRGPRAGAAAAEGARLRLPQAGGQGDRRGRRHDPGRGRLLPGR